MSGKNLVTHMTYRFQAALLGCAAALALTQGAAAQNLGAQAAAQMQASGQTQAIFDLGAAQIAAPAFGYPYGGGLYPFVNYPFGVNAAVGAPQVIGNAPLTGNVVYQSPAFLTAPNTGYNTVVTQGPRYPLLQASPFPVVQPSVVAQPAPNLSLPSNNGVQTAPTVATTANVAVPPVPAGGFYGGFGYPGFGNPGFAGNPYAGFYGRQVPQPYQPIARRTFSDPFDNRDPVTLGNFPDNGTLLPELPADDSLGRANVGPAVFDVNIGVALSSTGVGGAILDEPSQFSSGIGGTLQVGTKVANNFAVRGQFGIHAINASSDWTEISNANDQDPVDASGISYNGALILDWHPVANGFRVSAGPKVVGVDLDVDLDDDANGTTDGIFAVDGAAFGAHVGVGYDSSLFSQSPWSLWADVGADILFSGYDISNCRNGNGTSTGQTDADCSSTLQADYAEARDVDEIQIYPTLNIGLTYRF